MTEYRSSGDRDDTSLPETGSVEIVEPEEAIDLVEDIAQGVAEPADAADSPILVVLDIDGTILLEDETLSPGIVEAVKDARAAGNEVMLATGRSWEGTRGILRALDISPEYVVCSNGAVVLQRVDAADVHYERVHTETFDATTVLTLLREHLPDAHYLVELPTGERMYTQYLEDWNLLAAHRVPFEELTRHPVCRVVVVSPDHDERDFLTLVEDIGLNQVSYAIGWTAWLDIAPQGVDKGTALEIVRTWLGITPERVLVIGDGRNDVGMFRWALEHGGRAIAMAQGPDEVREAAGEITSSVEEGGVAAILRDLPRGR
ncbi:HAD-IIB family hydrolase [Microbacterium sp. LRZ72]|uniref:HAD family hydrolase n=1 Tax=Microbacterium sp. LRZ72 TaxID=2942481 RepID=UPI0029AFA972|nr:HAD-IIB family hydrolase [Microbacterium sp. LRZ72]MDX2376497.1 HAD-IIB family hydrolase [Microbacterium sp. LRZ72]